jgi:hypothetical protein
MPNPYKLTGTKTPGFIGRSDLLGEILGRLEKPTPDHVSVVGEKYFGKTVLLNELNHRLSSDSDYFDGCTHFSVKHDTISGDADFYSVIAKKIAPAVESIDPEIANDLRSGGLDIWEMTRIVFETLEERGERVLVLFDDFDVVPLIDGLTKNVWDNLRALASRSSIRFVTASRRPLRELHSINPEEWWTSDFHRIFASVRVGAMGEDGLNEFLEPILDRADSLADGAKTEIMGQTGGIPPLVTQVCHQLWEQGSDYGTVQHTDVQEETKTLYENSHWILSDLWEQLSESKKEVLTDLASGTTLMKGKDVRTQTVNSLETRGCVRVDGQKVKSGSRLLSRFAREYGDATTSLGRHFGDCNSYEQNIPRVLEHRFEHVDHLDERLRDFTRNALEKTDTLHVLLQQIRAIARRGTQLTIRRELPDGEIPDEWIRKWQDSGLHDCPQGETPDSTREQLSLIRKAVDNRNSIETTVTRSTYELLEFLHRAGNFGQHLGDEPVYQGFAMSVCMAAIELCNQLNGEFGT